MLTRIALALFKNETTYGVDPTPAPATDAVLISDLTMTVDGRVLNRNTLDASLSRRPHVIGRKLINVSFRTELKGSGTQAHRRNGASYFEPPALPRRSRLYRVIISQYQQALRAFMDISIGMAC